MADTTPNWKHFERLVTAIHHAADRGAQVKWNEKIDGRQFDITIRFRRGLYDYLTVVECKDYATAVPVGEVEAFVTKAADAKADRAIMASTSGFQEGAKKVAARYKMTLIHVSESSEIDLSVFNAEWAGTTEALHFEKITIQYADGHITLVPMEPNAMEFYVRQVVIQSDDEQGTLEDLLSNNLHLFSGAKLEQFEDYAIPCPPGTRVIAPLDDQIPLGAVKSFHVRAGLTVARLVRSPLKFETHLLQNNISVRDVSTGEETQFRQQDLVYGIDTEFSEGSFYEQPNLPGSYFFCERVHGLIADLFLVESFQNGILIQCELKIETQYSRLYVPILDKVLIERLRNRFTALKKTLAKD